MRPRKVNRAVEPLVRCNLCYKTRVTPGIERLPGRLYRAVTNGNGRVLRPTTLPAGGNMSANKDSVVRIELTEKQKQQVKEATGKELDAVEFTAEALEDRVAPVRVRSIVR